MTDLLEDDLESEDRGVSESSVLDEERLVFELDLTSTSLLSGLRP